MDKYEALKSYFGYQEFRHSQEEIIDEILAHRDVLGVMPTGGGKSICYQLPALLMPGITIVISPLISLMKDQVGALKAAGIPGAFINGALTPSQTETVIQRAENHAYKLIYVAPERLLMPRFLRFCEKVDISFVAVDEAHCVSQWGHDFRSAYLAIGDFIAALKQRPVLAAFTATATEEVRSDIQRLLGLADPAVFISGFDRPNLYFEVRHPKSKFDELRRILDTHDHASGIVYCATRKGVDEVCARLSALGYEVTRYHAGLSDRERKQNQDDFLYDRQRIMVATNAFGMGIDKSNVSFVIHYNMPKNPESYYQEAGRAGRDGSDADCILLYDKKDIVINRYFIDHSFGGEDIDAETAQRMRENELHQLDQMIRYCTTDQCLRRMLLSYFGEDVSEHCGHCGNCGGDFITMDRTEEGRLVLACVSAVRQRFGLKMITDILHGSRGKRILEMGLDGLSVYGALAKTATSEIKDLIQDMIFGGYLATKEGEYPLILLTEKGYRTLEEGNPVELRKRRCDEEEAAEKKPKEKHTVTADPDMALFEVLRQKRREIAEAEGVPAFVVFSDATLRDMCAKRPQNEEEMLEVSGIGKVKLQRYGADFLPLLATAVALPAEEEPVFTTEDSAAASTPKAWELARKLTDEAVPRLLTEEEQTWEANMEVGEADDAHLRLLWHSNVPGSFAPESIMLSAVQAKENLGYTVKNGVELWQSGQKALADNDMPELNRISALLWQAVNHGEKNPAAPSWRYVRYESWAQYAAAVTLPPPEPVAMENLEARIYAGWLGQIIGGALGTMLEGYTTDAIRKTFGEVHDYLRKPSTYNDDITYELAFLRAYEAYGSALTSGAIAEEWIALIPAGWSAEELALRNIRWGLMPPESGQWGNPFGEWIGAQMRGAVCGLVAPGDPAEAARLAWLDGEVSHFANGILGEIFNGVLVSLAFVEKDVRKILQRAAALIPKDSEYAAVLAYALKACADAETWEPAWRLCEKRLERYNWIHAYPNAAAEVVALWFGEGDFDRTAHIIAMAGQDVDCNAAQILTVIGVLRGIKGIDSRWRDPIGDTLQTYMRRERKLSIRRLAARTAAAAKKSQ